MNTKRFIGIILIFGAVSLAWFLLGGSVTVRTDRLHEDLSAQMQTQWGPDVVAQASPYVAAAAGDGRFASGSQTPASSEMLAHIQHENRNKGLLWFSTFSVKFTGTFTVEAASDTADAHASAGRFFIFPLPDGVTGYDQLEVSLDGKPRSAAEWSASRRIALPLSPGPHEIVVSYMTFGQKSWIYMPSENSVKQVKQLDGYARGRGSEAEKPDPVYTAGELWQLNNFHLTITTDFHDIDYPKGSRSPSVPALAVDDGMKAQWQYASAWTAQPMGIVVPQNANAGPIAARMSFFAPVSLFFFFTVLFVLVVLKGVRLHPMHYLFVAAGFFAFHILLAYLSDLCDIQAAFWICAVVSVLLVTSYLRLVGGVKFALLYAGVAQLVFLVGFSYAFFWVGKTGLSVTVCAIATLFVLMQATGRVNWHDVFSSRSPNSPPPPPQRFAPHGESTIEGVV